MAASRGRDMNSRIPIIVILGATGSGKSKLGIEIARKFGGEILSADSMQVYKGLDIVTNKVTAEERSLAPHHLLDIVKPPKRFTVLDFRNRSLPIIEKLMQEGKLPVIVGGTNYYIESLLWNVLVGEHGSSLNKEEREPISNPEEAQDDGDGTTLKEQDDDRAKLVVLEKKVLDGNCDSAELLDVLCQKKDPDKSDFSAVCRKRILDSDEKIYNTKCQKVQAGGVGLKSFSVVCQRGRNEEGEEVNCGAEAPNFFSTECQMKVLDHSEDVTEIQSKVHSETVRRDKALGEVCQDVDSLDSTGLSDMCNKVQMCQKVGSQKVESVNNKSQIIEVDSELAYERDKRMLQDGLSDKDMESKRMHTRGDNMNFMDEASLEHVPSPQLHEKLQAVDPDMADQLHPNNKRKIIRSLQVYAQTGRTHSAILQEQRSLDGGSELGGPLRYPHSCIIWLQCEQGVLDKRLDLRVDAMLDQGLVQELLDFHRCYNEERLVTNTQPDYTKGIFQSIGFKEFHDYLVLSEEERSSDKSRKMFQAGVDALKLVTKRYARRQLRWITNRFLRRPSRQVPPVYGLDATDPSVWDERVLGPAVQIVKSYLEGQKPVGVEPLPVAERPVKNDMKTHHCDVCDRIFVGDIQWNTHLHSRKHHKRLKCKQVHKD